MIGPDVLGNIIAAASDISVVISDLGEVLSVLVNPAHSATDTLGGWQGREFRSMLTSESVEKFDARLAELNAGNTSPRPLELNHLPETGLAYPLRYSFHTIGPDGAILLLGRDLKPVAQMQQQLVETQMALERDYEHQREISTRMKVLMETTRDAVVFVNAQTGKIAELNGKAARLLNGTVDEISGSPLSKWIGQETGPLDLVAMSANAQDEDAGPISITVRAGKQIVKMRPIAFRAAGERLVLCRFDQDSADEGLNDDSIRLSQLFEQTSDGLVFCDRTGRVTAANAAFLSMADLDGINVIRGRPLSDFLVRGAVDLKVLLDNASRNGRIKSFATRLSSPFGDEIAVEVSAVHLADPKHPGFGLILRDAPRVDPGQTTQSGTPVRPARDLVGATTLKEIVAETTDVIEKMCIETALELTDDNRVAAAEMLGLSRQSLYVKLRKYALLARED
ncbi:transcriptional regulator PpsR [Palleronia sp. THAF1]|uniref:transcriptional regulator PpsR n=1 Tax=Palleronia sp. THAF1 TaxID=2587842 RepID=UPI0020C79843|nr:transcriptional regulator PpsR [Palleronia sp. THAF1]